jgi:hypothetical protein
MMLYGQHFTITEVSHLVDNFTHPLPKSLLGPVAELVGIEGGVVSGVFKPRII